MDQQTASIVLGVPALLTAVASFYASIAASKTSKNETQKKVDGECDERMRKCRTDALELADENYELRTKRGRANEAT